MCEKYFQEHDINLKDQKLGIDHDGVEENTLITQVARLLEPIGEVNSATQPIVINFTVYESN